MKKHLKKLLLVVGLVAMATIAEARVWLIECGDGRMYNYVSFETDPYRELMDAMYAGYDLCMQ